MVLKAGSWLVANGNDINIREDKWVADGGSVALNDRVHISKVCELIDQPNHRWNVPLLSQIFPITTIHRILATPIRWTQGNDEVWWPQSNSGILTVKSAYHALRIISNNQQDFPSSSTGTPNVLWKVIWNAKVPQKIKLFLWKLVHNILPVQENIFKKRITRSRDCPICKKEPETIEHTFLRCEWTRPVWFGLELGSSFTNSNVNSLLHWLIDWLDGLHNCPIPKDYSVLKMCCSLWLIWKSRNAFVY